MADSTISAAVQIVCTTAIVIAILIKEEPRYMPMGGNSDMVLDTHKGEIFKPKHRISFERHGDYMRYIWLPEYEKWLDTSTLTEEQKNRLIMVDDLSQSEIAKIEGELKYLKLNDDDTVCGELYNGNPKICIDSLVITVVTIDGNGIKHTQKYYTSSGSDSPLILPMKTGHVSRKILLKSGHKVQSCYISKAEGRNVDEPHEVHLPPSQGRDR